MNSLLSTILAKAPLPTHLSSAEIRAELGRGLRARSVFSARTPEYAYVARLQDVLAKIAAGEINQAKGRELLLAKLGELGYDPATGFNGEGPALDIPPAEAGSLTDLSSSARLKLVAETNTRQIYSQAMAARGASPEALAQFPAWRLARVYPRRVARSDWPARWQAAYAAVSGEGAAASDMVALKSSPVWQALGDGAGGYTDTLGTSFPPFAFGSGHMWLPVPAADAAALGLQPSGPSSDLGPLSSVSSLSPGESEIAAALTRLGPDFSSRLRAELGGQS